MRLKFKTPPSNSSGSVICIVRESISYDPALSNGFFGMSGEYCFESDLKRLEIGTLASVTKFSLCSIGLP